MASTDVLVEDWYKHYGEEAERQGCDVGASTALAIHIGRED